MKYKSFLFTPSSGASEMQLTQKWLNETLAKNPALSIQVQCGKDCAKASKAKEVKVTHPKYGNHKVYAYEDGFVAGNKDAKEHGNIVDVFDSTKEYCRWLDLQILEKGGSITELKRQVPLTIQEAFQYEGKRIQKIDYRADFYYRDKNGTVVVEDVKGYDQKNGKYIQTEAFRLKWKLLKSKYPDYHFVLY